MRCLPGPFSGCPRSSFTKRKFLQHSDVVLASNRSIKSASNLLDDSVVTMNGTNEKKVDNYERVLINHRKSVTLFSRGHN